MPGWLPAVGTLLPVLAALLAEDRFAGLGHALAGQYLLSRTGSLNRRQVLLRADGIIGWRFRQYSFQRRAGLATLTATTAAGQAGLPGAGPGRRAPRCGWPMAALPGLLDGPS